LLSLLAGIQFVSPVQDFPEDKWDDIIAVCLNSAFHTTKAALPYMLDQVRSSSSSSVQIRFRDL
jgi:NAD(P)-dependent dehydrogenase (short-subunit alcohol dehydrogenase family)